MQCRHVLDMMAEIPEDEWTAKSADIAAEQDLEGAREVLHNLYAVYVVYDEIYIAAVQRCSACAACAACSLCL